MTPDGLTEEGTLLFGAGFAFGATVTLLLFGVVLAVTLPGDPALLAALRSPILITVLAAVAFAGIVGIGLSVLAFPETRPTVPVDPGGPSDDE